MINYYKSRCILIGKDINFTLNNKLYEGQAIDITNEGHLVVKTNETEMILKSGEVSIGSKYYGK